VSDTHILSSTEGETTQDTQKQLRERGLTSCRARRKGRLRTPNKPSEQGALTNYHRAQWEEQVRTPSETERVKATHPLSSTEGGTSQDIKQTSLSEGHSHTVEYKERDKSEHRTKPSEQGHPRPVKRRGRGMSGTPEETDQARGTHRLPSAGGRMSQDTERNRGSGHTPTVERRGREKSGHQNRPNELGALTPCRAEGGTLFRTCQNTGRNRASEGHSLSVERRGIVRTSRKPSRQGALTNYRGQVKTRKEGE
jgi:hypothetical protein